MSDASGREVDDFGIGRKFRLDDSQHPQRKSPRGIRLRDLRLDEVAPPSFSVDVVQ